MSVDRTHVGHQTRCELRDEAGLSCALTYTADPDQPATCKILLRRRAICLALLATVPATRSGC
jgi:hypothetical protein